MNSESHVLNRDASVAMIEGVKEREYADDDRDSRGFHAFALAGWTTSIRVRVSPA